MSHQDRATPPYHLVRFDQLQPLTKNPADTFLPRYRRERFSVVGRADERRAGEPGISIDAAVNFGFIRCAPGTGNCSHKHPNWEIFIPLSGRWRLVLEGGPLEGRGELFLEPWDLILVPPDTFHEATNVGAAEACMLSLNPGKKGAAYTLHPEVIEELRSLGPEIEAAARHAVDIARVK
jgi:oxalate decarboxylase/phosphoglucose isomerase-like protein (cupin superfamily)